MQLDARTIDDFKADRKGITPPLPTILRLVPILLYCSIAVTVLLVSLFLVQYRMATQKRDGHLLQAKTLLGQKDASRNDRSALEIRIKKATDVKSWVAGSRQLQPLIMEITRSMAPKSTIMDLRLERDAASPAQLKLALRLGTDTTKQLDTTLERMATQKYRVLSPEQQLGRGELAYRATLIRQEPDRQPEAPLPPAPKP